MNITNTENGPTYLGSTIISLMPSSHAASNSTGSGVIVTMVVQFALVEDNPVNRTEYMHQLADDINQYIYTLVCF